MKIKIYTTWKAGSQFTRKFFSHVANEKGLHIEKITASRFQENPQKIELNTKLPQNNYCAILYRYFPDLTTLNDDNIKHIIQIRDPRDVLVSLYYSMAYSHGYGTFKKTEEIHKKIQKIPIDKFVIDNYRFFLELYKNVIISKNYNNKIYLKYSDMVLNFKKWTANACEFFELPKIKINNIYDIFRKEFTNVEKKLEEKDKHKRKMLPGDHENKLNNKTIELLNKEFLGILEFINDNRIYK